MTHLQSSLWCVPRVKVRGCWRDHHMMKEPSAPITFWLADASSLPPRLDVSLPMPRFSYMQAAPACSRVIPDRLSDKAHEEGKGTSSEDTWGQKWACFDKLRLPLRWFNSGIFWAFESYNYALSFPSGLFATANITSQTLCIIPYLFMHWAGDAHRKVEEKFLCTATYCRIVYHNILKNPCESQWSWFDAIWSPRYFWFGALAGKFGCRTGRAHSWGGYLGWFSWKISMKSAFLKWYNSFPARIQHGNHGVWSCTIVVVLIRTGIMCYWLEE